MKTIEWDLPFKTMEFLAYLTTSLAVDDEVILVVAREGYEDGEIDSCLITLKETEDEDSQVLWLGEMLGIASAMYSVESEDKSCACQREKYEKDLEEIQQHFAKLAEEEEDFDDEEEDFDDEEEDFENGEDGFEDYLAGLDQSCDDKEEVTELSEEEEEKQSLKSKYEELLKSFKKR